MTVREIFFNVLHHSFSWFQCRRRVEFVYFFLRQFYCISIEKLGNSVRITSKKKNKTILDMPYIVLFMLV